MNPTTKLLVTGVAVAALFATGTYAIAQQGPGFGHGPMGRGMGHATGMRHDHGPMGMGRGAGMGAGMMGMMGGTATASEMQELHEMFVNHDRIKRTVTNLPNGIRTVTESDDPEIAGIIVSHVVGMMKRVEEGRDPKLPIQSPWLKVIFRNKDKIETSVEPTEKGIVVMQTSTDAETVTALQKHAADVNEFVRRGMAAAHETMMRNMASRRGPRDQ
jgi:hypothetical protein